MTLLTNFSKIYKPIDMVPDETGAAPARVALAPDRLKPRVELVAPLPEVVVKQKPEAGALCPVKLKPVDPDPPPVAPAAGVVVFGAKLKAGAALVAGAAAEEALVFAVKLKAAAAVAAPWVGVEVVAAGGAGVD